MNVKEENGRGVGSMTLRILKTKQEVIKDEKKEKKPAQPEPKKKPANSKKKQVNKFFTEDDEYFTSFSMTSRKFVDPAKALEDPDSDTNDTYRADMLAQNVIEVTGASKEVSRMMSLWNQCTIDENFDLWKMDKQAYFKLCTTFATKIKREVLAENLQQVLRYHYFNLFRLKLLSASELLKLIADIPNQAQNVPKCSDPGTNI